uniref:Uncharacterized protein n=1 Tax=Coccidioides posadasii RMSCC 3488 TaxID=454284 RepID=A0A0J6I8P5_COCPO|nr:hypothetical protein CPAG_04231 [Coccidioides posadasii RMSCC 3488]
MASNGFLRTSSVPDLFSRDLAAPSLEALERWLRELAETSPDRPPTTYAPGYLIFTISRFARLSVRLVSGLRLLF